MLAFAHGGHHAAGDLGIRSTAICPAFVATDLATGLPTRPLDAMMPVNSEPEESY